MKKIISLVFLLFFACSAHAGDTVTIKHRYYTSHFVNSKHIPWFVEYTLHKKDVSCTNPVDRKDNFKADPLNKKYTDLVDDYYKSGYDQGHCRPAADNLCHGVLLEQEGCYFSNVMPQTVKLNRGLWSRLESKERDMAKASDSIFVCIGNFGTAEVIGDNEVVVPRYCWKVIYDYKNEEWWGFIFPNTSDLQGKIEDFAVSVEEIEDKAGIEFITE